jgi:serine/threonine protein kinase
VPFERTGPFRLLRRLGQGGFAPVYLAEEAHEGRKLRDVALKLFCFEDGGRSAESAAARERVIDEARALCRVEHPHVVRFHAVHRDDALGVLALVMEHVSGESLFTRLHERGMLGDAEVIDVGVEIAWALAAVHDAGLVHGDVKPSNVIRGPHGHKLIDFGIATDLAPASADAPVFGTPGYLAPERLERGAPPSPATDLYALGVTLHRLRTGKMPAVATERAEGDLPGNAAPGDDRRGSDQRGDDRPGSDARGGEQRGDDRPRSDARGGEQRGDDRPRSDARGRAGADGDALGSLIARLIAADPNERPQRAAQVARELQALRPRREGDREPPSFPVRRERPGSEDPTLDAAAMSEGGAPQPTLAQHPPLVGRESALRALAAWAARTSEGRLSVTLLRGPLGAGRTRLLDAAIEATGAPPTRVLRGACSPERQSSFLPLLRALEAVPRGRGPGLSAIEEAVGDALDPRTLGASRDPRAAVEAVEEALLWAAASDPLVLAIDDAQWGDPYTITLLVLLCDRAHAGGEGKLHVVIAARDEPRPSAPLRALFAAARSRPDGSATTIALGPLSPEELGRAAEGVGALAPDLSQAVVRAAGGIPFFLVHALFAWRDTGAIAFREGAWRAVDPGRLLSGVPGVAELVEARLASAFEGDPAASRVAMRALAAVALYGGVALDTLLATCGDLDTVEAALETLVGMGILAVRGPRFEHAFAQEMIRQAVLSLVRDKPWFARLHRALLDALARAPEAQVDAAFLAAGYDELGDADQARAWLRRAMERAIAAGLLAEAVAMGDRRAALARTAAERAEAQLDAVRALLAAPLRGRGRAAPFDQGQPRRERREGQPRREPRKDWPRCEPRG